MPMNRTRKSHASKIDAVKTASKNPRQRQQNRGKKIGSPGCFSDAHVKFLTQYADDYCTAEGKKQQQKFWGILFPAYWDAFPWHLGTEPEEFMPLSQTELIQAATNNDNEPGTTALSSDTGASPGLATETEEQTVGPANDKDSELGTPALSSGIGASPGLTKDQLAERCEEALRELHSNSQVQEQIKGWFIHHKLNRRRVNGQSNPFTAWLQQLSKPNVQPRAPHLWQTYMKQPKAAACIDEVFKERWPSQALSESYNLDFRAKIAQELLELETDEFKQTLRDKAEADLQEKLNAFNRLWEDGGSGLASQDPEIQELCHANLGTTVGPLLEAVLKHTGLHNATLLCGSPPAPGLTKFNIITVSAGQTHDLVPKSIAEWEPDKFKSTMLSHYMRFLTKTSKDMTVAGDDVQNADIDGVHHAVALNSSSNANSAEKSAPVENSRTPPANRRRRDNHTRGDEEDEDNDEETYDEDEEDEEDEEDQLTDDELEQVLQRRASPERLFTPPLPEGRELNDELRQELDAMPVQQRRLKMAWLGAASKYEFERRKNIARNNKLLGSLNVSQALGDLQWGTNPKRKAGRKAKRRSAELKSHPAQRRQSTRLQLLHHSAPIAQTQLPVLSASSHSQSSSQTLPNKQFAPDLRSASVPLIYQDSPSHTPPPPSPSRSAFNVELVSQPSPPPADPSTLPSPLPSRFASEPLMPPPSPPCSASDASTPPPSLPSRSASEPLMSPPSPPRSASDASTPPPSSPSRSASDPSVPPPSPPYSTSDASTPPSRSASEPPMPPPPPPPSPSRSASNPLMPSPSPPCSASNPLMLPTECPTAQGQAAGALAQVNNPDVAHLGEGWSPQHSVDLTKLPKWMSMVLQLLQHQEADRVVEWRELVLTWIDVEAEQGFLNAVNGLKLPTEKRPPQVAEWIKNARKPSKVPHITDMKVFADGVWQWWSSMNPSWRCRNEKGQIVVEAGGSGSWEGLLRPGQNGLVSVLACLMWWFRKEGGTVEWKEIVEDVLWAMHELHRFAVLRKRKEPDSQPNSESDTAPLSKKARTSL